MLKGSKVHGKEKGKALFLYPLTFMAYFTLRLHIVGRRRHSILKTYLKLLNQLLRYVSKFQDHSMTTLFPIIADETQHLTKPASKSTAAR